jgi:hypothetical protein
VAAFTLSLSLDGAAFTDDPADAVAALLDQAAYRLRRGRLEAAVLDVNGNRCGAWVLELDPDAEPLDLDA